MTNLATQVKNVSIGNVETNRLVRTTGTSGNMGHPMANSVLDSSPLALKMKN